MQTRDWLRRSVAVARELEQVDAEGLTANVAAASRRRGLWKWSQRSYVHFSLLGWARSQPAGLLTKVREEPIRAWTTAKLEWLVRPYGLTRDAAAKPAPKSSISTG